MIDKLIYFLVKVFYFLVITQCMVSCNTKDSKDTSKIFRYNEHKNINSLDPAFSKDLADIWATNQLFNGLVQMDNNLNVIPSIAKSWSISKNAKIYTFNLRDDVYFHTHKLFKNDSTRRVNAEDFEFSFNRLKDEELASPGGWVLNKVASFKALDTNTFQIRLKQPFPAFLGLLTMKYCSVVPKEIVSFYGADFRSNPIGTGPFKFKRWEENVKLVFRKNVRYFEKDSANNSLPYLEAVAITFLPEKQSEFLQFAQGNIDFLNSLDDSYKDELLTAKGLLREHYANTINMLRGPYLNTEYLAFFMDSDLSEIQSNLIREAVNLGFDRKRMMTYLRNGIGIPANGGFIPKGLPGYNASIGYIYNPGKAKQLIETFKKQTKNPTPSITITTTSNYLSFSEYIQRELEKIGLRVIVDVIPPSSLKEAKANGKLNMFRASWIADYPDAENYLSLYYSKNFAPNGPNYTHYNNTLFDMWYEKAFTETNTKKRERLYTKMDSLVMKGSPVVPLYYDEVIRFTRNGVFGIGINPINMLDLKYVKKTK